MELEDILLVPDPARVMEGMRDTGYDFNTAVADIIDNSIAANAKNIDLLVDLDLSGNPFVYCADDGCGMDLEGLKNAMRYGSAERDDKASLGKFGLGLKTASTAFCRSLSVVSKGSDLVMRKVQWDIDHIINTNDWMLRRPPITEDEADYLNETSGSGTGTLVVWEKVDRLIGEYKRSGHARNAMKKITDSLRFHISMVYQRFLDESDNRACNVTITLNGKAVEPWDPFCITEENTVLLYEDELEIEMDDNPTSDLTIRAYLIPRRDEFSTPAAGERARVSNDMQGFYVYRENRLIYHGGWMGMYSKEPHGSLLRVELSFDHTLDEALQVDIKKSQIRLNEALYQYIKDSVLPAPRRAADERYRKGTKKKVEESAAGAHDASNRSIDEKALSVEESRVEVINPTNNEVSVTNRNGTFKHTISIRENTKPNQCRVIPVDNMEGGFLWAPVIADGKHAVEINMGHPYYQKVYFPILKESVLVTGLDSLLWALSEAELSTFNNNTREQYEEMRLLVSRSLKKLVADLPEPDTEGE